MQSFRDLLVWQKSVVLATKIYQITEKFPKHEQYRLIDQICRAVVSIPSNIAEGYQRQTRREYIQFLHIAYGSCAETETQLLIASNLRFINESEYQSLLSDIEEIEKMLRSLISKLKLASP